MSKSMSKQIYKVYDPDGNMLIFESLTDLRIAFDLLAEDVSKCFLPGVHHNIGFGFDVITY